MLSINIALPRPWVIEFPKVIRYMDKCHIDEFFKTGSLMLTTFKRCKIHEEENRKDSNEGGIQFEIKHGNLEAKGWHNVGFQSYMLCTSLVESEQLMSKFKVNGYFIINNILAFSDVISRYIPGFTNGMVGVCAYEDARKFSKNSNENISFSSEELARALENEDHAQVESIINKQQESLNNSINRDLGKIPYFIKENSFKEEAELRIIWSVPYDTQDTIIIKCPEARQFCSYEGLISNEINSQNNGDGRGIMMVVESNFEE